MPRCPKYGNEVSSLVVCEQVTDVFWYIVSLDGNCLNYEGPLNEEPHTLTITKYFCSICGLELPLAMKDVVSFLKGEA